jgi:hypothetical protein
VPKINLLLVVPADWQRVSTMVWKLFAHINLCSLCWVRAAELQIKEKRKLEAKCSAELRIEGNLASKQ